MKQNLKKKEVSLIANVSIQFSSVAQSCLTLCNPMNCSTPGLPVHHELPEFTQTHVYWVSDAIQAFHPLSSPSPPAFNLSQHQGLYKWVSFSQSIGVSASASVLPMNTQDWSPLGWTDWIPLQSVQGTLKSLLQHHSSKASIVWCSAFFTVQLSHPYLTTGKTVALTRRTFVGKVMSLFFNMLSRLVITFLPRSKSLLISWLQSPSAVILEPKSIKVIKFKVKNLSIKKVLAPDGFTGEFYTAFKEEITSILYKLCQKTEEKGILPNSYEAALSLYQNQTEMLKEKCRPVSHINKIQRLLTEFQQREFNSILKR